MVDQVMKPKQKSRAGGIKQVGAGGNRIEGPNASTAHLNPYNRKGKKK